MYRSPSRLPARLGDQMLANKLWPLDGKAQEDGGLGDKASCTKLKIYKLSISMHQCKIFNKEFHYRWILLNFIDSLGSGGNLQKDATLLV